MIYWRLFAAFLKIGLFSFGGAYGAIPLIRDVVMEEQWADEAMFANLVALSETTPGPIMVNMATYIGSKQAGLPGALLATTGVVFPSFAIILAVTLFFRNALKQKPVQAVLKGIKPCLMGVILGTGVWMAATICLGGSLRNADLPAGGIFLVLAGVLVLYPRLQKKAFPPIALIVLGAVCGCVFYP